MNSKTLLDEFAMAALAGLLADPEFNIPADELAVTCYKMADAMMAERAKRMPQAVPAADVGMPDNFRDRILYFAKTKEGSRANCTEVFRSVVSVQDAPTQKQLNYIGTVLTKNGYKRCRSGGKDYYQL